jgi:hypothetical protein
MRTGAPIDMKPLVCRIGGFSIALSPLLLMGCWILLGLSASSAVAQSDIDAATAERRIKAAFIYKFAGYVEWPEKTFASADAPIVIGVEGDDRLADELIRIVTGRTAAGRSLVVRKLKKEAIPGDLQVLFAADDDEGRHAAGGASARHMLVVTDMSGALARGSTINFVVVDGHVRFEISLADAERRGLKLSSRMLAVAEDVLPGTQ